MLNNSSCLLFSCLMNTVYFQSAPQLCRSFPTIGNGIQQSFTDTVGQGIWKIKYSKDFPITGDGSAETWNSTDWLTLPLCSGNEVTYQTKMKLLYSDSGIYCLYYCEDNKITATLKEDFLDLWHEDVIEAFFWTDETVPLYFEYELSPLNYELPILVPNMKGKFFGWRPWHYEGDRRTKHATHISKYQTTVNGWTAEFFIPYTLLTPLMNVPPGNGTRWRANFYRIDHDHGEATWQWQKVPGTFHDYEKFGTIVFD